MEPTIRTAVVIEDDADIRDLLETVLGQGGFVVHSAGTGSEGVALVAEVDPLVITLDVSLPDFDGFEVARRVRAFSDAYIVMLTAFTEEVDTLMGLDAGADDYVAKPFRPRELRARIAAMLRRPRRVPTGSPDATRPTSPPPGGPDQARSAAIPPEGASTPPALPATASAASASPVPSGTPDQPAWDGLSIDVGARTVTVDGEEVALTKSEFDILAKLVEQAGRVVSKSDLVRTLWGDTYDVGTLIGPADHRSIEVHVANLRRKIGDNAAEARWIDTVRGVGYRFRARA